MLERRSGYEYEDLLACGRGELFGPGNAQLPLPPMLMFDRISEISETGGEYGKGVVRAELDVKPDLWFFACHFKGDPVMPGCLGLDALWQLLGFYLGWGGSPGKGRALGLGELKFSGQVLPNVNTLTRNAARQAYEAAGVGPEDLDLVELHDCFATAELVHYDNLMLCDEGGAADFFNSGATWRDGSTPVNVSGGLESKGHPIAATGIANVWEICHHLRGEAGDRQIENAKVGLAHVIGLGSACGVHILEKSAA